MNIFFRADASDKIGTGHVMRCLTLADELTKRGASISFICREEPRNLIKSINDKGYKVYHLPAGIGLETDLELVKKILKDRPIQSNWLIVDHYDIDFSWENPLRGFVEKIMVIDDLANRQHDCDLLLDQNFTINVNCYDEMVPAQCIKLVGAEYTLIRPQFLDAREGLRERNGRIKRILVFMSGADPSNETRKVLRAIQMLNCPDIITEVVIGASNPNRNEIEKFASRIPGTTCHFNVENMAKLMVTADVSIGGGGTATWERCCLGLPTIVAVLSENQEQNAKALAKQGSIVNLGWANRLGPGDYLKEIKNLNTQRLKSMSIRGLELIDGKGCLRVVDHIFN
jgi:UDP-2,4-diacetamido-2,4,6-trideoxy-beta-L-altropyranose hydrolase